MTLHPTNPGDSEVAPDDALEASLSALMDGEASELEVQRLLKRMESDDAMRAQWARYQQVAAIIRHREVVVPVSVDLANRVRVALQDDTVVVSLPSLPQKKAREDAREDVRQKKSWQKNMAQIAVAASVAVVVITGAQWQQQVPVNQQAALVSATAVAVAQPVDGAVLHKIEQLSKPDIFSQSNPEFAANMPPLLASQPVSAARKPVRPAAVPLRQ
jgi:sigma-E factor negative regulatory protein RseA